MLSQNPGYNGYTINNNLKQTSSLLTHSEHISPALTVLYPRFYQVSLLHLIQVSLFNTEHPNLKDTTALTVLCQPLLFHEDSKSPFD